MHKYFIKIQGLLVNQPIFIPITLLNLNLKQI
jgi:hypothetical protein